MKYHHILAAVVLTSVTSAVAHADTIELKNGQKYSGSMARRGDVMVIKTDDGQTISAKPEDVLRVTLTGSTTPAEAAANEWKRLTMQIKSADSLDAIIDLHKKYLIKYPNAPQADEVRSSQEVYQKLADTGGVKFRGRWMPRTQIEVVIKQWADAARPAVELYRTGQLKESLASVKSVLAADDQNPDALAVGGLAAYQLNTLPQARTYFLALAAADPASLLAENDLAVVSSQQKQPGESLIHYEKALQIAPDNRFLLDNIAEALNAYTGDKTASNYRNLIRTFEPAETKMEAEMAKKGLQRWGATWVTKEQADTLRKTQAAVQSQMARLDAQYQSVHDAITALEAQIKQANAAYDGYQNDYNTYTGELLGISGSNVDVTSLLIARDAAWQNMDRMNRYRASLEARRAQLVANSSGFFAEADRLKAELASTQTMYTGNQRIMDLGDVENTPAPVAVQTPPAPPANARPIVLPQPPVIPEPPPALVPVPYPAPVSVR